MAGPPTSIPRKTWVSCTIGVSAIATAMSGKPCGWTRPSCLPATRRNRDAKPIGDSHDHGNEAGGMDGAGRPRRPADLRPGVHHGGELQADGYQRDGGLYRG